MDGIIKQTHPLIGAGVKLRGEDDALHQAEIIAIIPSGSSTGGDLALLQFFDCMSGVASHRRLVALTELATERWTIYESADVMCETSQSADKAGL